MSAAAATRTGLGWSAAALCLLLLVFVAAPAAAQPRFRFDAAPGSLSKDVVPSRYELTLDLDPERDDFSGRAGIQLQVRKPVASFAVHAHELQPLGAVLVQGGLRRKLSIAPEPRTQTWRLAPVDGRGIPAGEHRLEIGWLGKVQRAGEALYRAEHEHEGRPVRMLATQLESVFARKVFPGFDEPAFRAVFELSVRAPKELSVVSNMPAAQQAEEGAAVLHRFQPTPSMPSYLLAVAVGRFDELAGEAAGVPLRILTAPGRREQARYALQVTQQVLPMFTEYFGVPYALPKLDQLAVPSGRDGAMEDWGLISYAESTLLFDPARSSPEVQRTVFSVVAHEVAHQWFGNLVTASSWDEIWLNEAFATWLQVKATDRFNPDWNVALERRLPIDRTMTLDAGPATRAIRSGPVRESRVFDVFDNITYVKGGAVLGMLEQWIGVETFRRGLAAYIEERKYSNATAGDLWFHLSQASGRDVSAVAASWTDQSGFPLVELRTVCDGGRTRVVLAQRRFDNTVAAADGTAKAPKPRSAGTADAAGAAVNTIGPAGQRLWKIPVLLSRAGQSSTLMLDAAQAEAELPGCGDEPVLANAGGEGFYRVGYDSDARQRLVAQFVQLAPADQVVLLSDTLALAQAGQVPMAACFELLALLPRVQGAARATLFTMAAAALEELDRALAGTGAQRRVRQAGARLFAPELDRLGWSPRAGDSAELDKLRALLVSRLARWDDDTVLGRARELFALDESGQAALPPAIRAAVIESVGLHADRRQFDQLMARLRRAASEEDRWMYAWAMAGGRDVAQARELMALSLADVLPPNIGNALPGLVGEASPLGALAYDFTLLHWDRLARGGGTWGGSSWLLPTAASQFHEPAHAARLVADQRRKAGADGAVPAAKVSAAIELRAALRRREAGALERLLADWQPLS